jgi:hypothetical protein
MNALPRNPDPWSFTAEERRARLVLIDLVEHLFNGPIEDADDTATWCAEEAALLPRGRWRDRITRIGIALDTGATPDLDGLALAWAELEGAC